MIAEALLLIAVHIALHETVHLLAAYFRRNLRGFLIGVSRYGPIVAVILKTRPTLLEALAPQLLNPLFLLLPYPYSTILILYNVFGSVLDYLSLLTRGRKGLKVYGVLISQEGVRFGRF